MRRPLPPSTFEGGLRKLEADILDMGSEVHDDLIFIPSVLLDGRDELDLQVELDANTEVSYNVPPIHPSNQLCFRPSA